MSKGMYCSASQWMDSDSSRLICGKLIFLTMTAFPRRWWRLLVLIFGREDPLMASITAPSP
jgi:hypothetical protein